LNLQDYIIIALLGGIIGLDKASFQMLFSEPVVICTALGAYWGQLELGLSLGLLWQLLWMGELPIGATKYPDGPTGSLLSTALYITLLKFFPQQKDLLLALCIFSGMIIAYLGGGFIIDKRKFHSRYVDYIDKYSSKGKIGKIENLFAIAVVEHFLARAIFALGLFIIFYLMVKFILDFIPVFWNGLFKDIHIAIWGISLAVILNLIWNRKTFWAIGSGLAIGFLIVRIF
jgi:mannose/fructose/N-acetylgalactosamine-specific phosphotransferase system component IIC